jgi:hypothetical protein
MMFDRTKKKEKRWNFIKKSSIYARFMTLKKKRMIRKEAKNMAI